MDFDGHYSSTSFNESFCLFDAGTAPQWTSKRWKSRSRHVTPGSLPGRTGVALAAEFSESQRVLTNFLKRPWAFCPWSRGPSALQVSGTVVHLACTSLPSDGGSRSNRISTNCALNVSLPVSSCAYLQQKSYIVLNSCCFNQSFSMARVQGHVTLDSTTASR